MGHAIPSGFFGHSGWIAVGKSLGVGIGDAALPPAVDRIVDQIHHQDRNEDGAKQKPNSGNLGRAVMMAHPR